MGRPPDVSQLDEVEEVLGVMSGSVTPVAGYKKLVSRQEGEGFVDSKGGLKSEQDECYEKRQMLWKGMTGKRWTEMLQQWGIAELQAVGLQKAVAAVMRDAGPALGDLHWRVTVGLGRESVVIPEEAVGMLEAARRARRLREPGWRGEESQGKWKAHRLLGWAARELAASRREVEMRLGD